MKGYKVPPIGRFRGVDYQHDQGGPLDTGEFAAVKHDSLEAVERHFSNANLHKELSIFLGDEVIRIEPYGEENMRLQVATTTNAPDKVAARYPDRLWMRGSFFEHDNCYIGVNDDLSATPAFVNFTTYKDQLVDVDILGSTHELVRLMREVNAANQQSLSE